MIREVIHTMLSRIDLHTHTSCSDGELPPDQLIDRAYKNGVKVLSIADHETVDGCQQPYVDYAKKQGIELVPGIEISTETPEGWKCHILGHFIDVENNELTEWIASLVERRNEFAAESVWKLQSLGWDISTDDLADIPVITKAHIAGRIVSNPSNQASLEQYFQGLPTRGQFIEAVMNKGRPGYVPRVDPPTVQEAVKRLHEAGGTATLAHPVASLYEQHMGLAEIESVARSAEFDGIEAIYYYYDKSGGDVLKERVDDFIVLARRLGLVAVGGSDFHAASSNVGNYVDVGLLTREKSMSEESLAQLRNLASR